MPLPFKYWGKGTEEIGVQTGPVDLLGLSLKPRQENEERKWLVNYFEAAEKSVEELRYTLDSVAWRKSWMTQSSVYL